MIRPFTFITALLFVLSGAYLFAVKHRAQMLDDQLAATTQATRLDAQRILVLQAQWALEVDPSRLAQLSTEFTNLQPMQPSQMVTLASLGSALPPPGSAIPGANPELPAPVAGPMVAQAAPAAPSAAAANNTVASQAPVPDHALVRLASVEMPIRANTPERVAQVRHAGLDNVEALLRTLPAGHHLYVRHEAVLHEYGRSRPEVQTASALAPESILPPPARLMGARVMSVRAVAPAAPPPMPQGGGSMLGMAQNTSAGSGNWP